MSLLTDLLANIDDCNQEDTLESSHQHIGSLDTKAYYIDELPEEILLHILSFLSDVDLQATRLVSPLLYILAGDHLLWRNLYARHGARLSTLLGRRLNSSELLRRGVIPTSDVRVLATSPKEFWETRSNLRRKLTMNSLERRLATRPILVTNARNYQHHEPIPEEGQIAGDQFQDESITHGGLVSSYPPQLHSSTPSSSFPPARREIYSVPAFSYQRSNHDISCITHPATVAPLLESTRKNLERAMGKDKISRKFVSRPNISEVVAKGVLRDTQVEVAWGICPGVRPFISRFEAQPH